MAIPLPMSEETKMIYEQKKADMEQRVREHNQKVGIKIPKKRGRKHTREEYMQLVAEFEKTGVRPAEWTDEKMGRYAKQFPDGK